MASDPDSVRAASADLLLGSACVGCDRPGLACVRRCQSPLEQSAAPGTAAAVSGRSASACGPSPPTTARSGGAGRPQGGGALSLSPPLGRALALSVLGAARRLAAGEPVASVAGAGAVATGGRPRAVATTRSPALTAGVPSLVARWRDRRRGCPGPATTDGVLDQAGLMEPPARANLAGAFAVRAAPPVRRRSYSSTTSSPPGRPRSRRPGP